MLEVHRHVHRVQGCLKGVLYVGVFPKCLTLILTLIQPDSYPDSDSASHINPEPDSDFDSQILTLILILILTLIAIVLVILTLIFG